MENVIDQKIVHYTIQGKVKGSGLSWPLSYVEDFQKNGWFSIRHPLGGYEDFDYKMSIAVVKLKF